MAEEIISVFDKLFKINVNGHTEQKNGLTYLSWSFAWAEVKKAFPYAKYTIYERETEWGPVNYFTDGRTCWVKTGVTIEGLEHIEELPVMDFKNKPIPYEAITSTDVNKAIQRSLTKACARHGLGLYVYAGEDLPEAEKEDTAKGMVEDLKTLWAKAGGKDGFDEWFAKNTEKGFGGEQYGLMKATLLKKINDKKEKE